MPFYIFFDVFENENVEISISQNANPKSQVPVPWARRPSPSIGLIK